MRARRGDLRLEPGVMAAARRFVAFAALCLGAAAAAAARPQDDLYRAVNGAWLEAASIPPDRAHVGTIDLLRYQSDERVRAIVEELAAGSDSGKDRTQQQIAAFWRSYMDVDAIDRAGLAPLAPWLAELDAAQGSRSELAALMGRWAGAVPLPLELGVDADPRDPGRYATTLWQGGLGLPDRDAYRGPLRAAYRRYLEALFSHAGRPDARRSAAIVLEIESELARAHWPEERNQDPRKVYNPTTPAALARRAAGFDWSRYLAAVRLGGLERVVVAQPGYLEAVARLAARTPPAHWRLYLEARLLDRLAPVLPGPLRDAHFELHGRALRGQAQPLPRWESAIEALEEALGESVGQLYVARHFEPAHKQRMLQIVEQLLAACREALDEAHWMGPQTRAAAQHKLGRYAVKIGYPDQWRDETGLEVLEDDALGNVMRSGRHLHERLAARDRRPVDRAEWDIPPQTVNAYYDPLRNEIVFPAGILEPPLFDMAAPDAANYGAIGAIIGHEISHGFDAAGSEFDGDGALRNWWTAADRRAYAALTRRIVADYGAYDVIPGHKLNGALTLNENIADLAGLGIAHRALRRVLAAQGVADTAPHERQFFEAWAVAWREKVRDERALTLAATDPHASGSVRVNANARNLDAFHAAFGTRRGDRMYKPPAARIRLW